MQVFTIYRLSERVLIIETPVLEQCAIVDKDHIQYSLGKHSIVPITYKNPYT